MERTKGIYCFEAGGNTEDILDFANMVFSLNHASTDFAALLPKAYSNKRQDMVLHHIIKENNKIRALIDLYPVTLQMHRTEMALKAAYVGTVSVHPKACQKGYMTELMTKAEQTAVLQGFDLMVLDGNRHRYRHFGFEKAGIRYSFYAGKRNIDHCCASMYPADYMAAPVYHFEELDEESPYLEELYALYLRRNVTARTMEDFFLCLQSYGAVTYAVLRGSSIMGYFNLSADEKTILEFELTDYTELARSLYDLAEGLECEAFGIIAGVDEPEKVRYLEKVSDSFQMSMSHQIKILNYAKTIEFLFTWKLQYTALENGCYTIGIRHTDRQKLLETIKINILDGRVEVHAVQEPADVIFDELDLVKMLTTGYYYTQQNEIQSKQNRVPAGWFPLPFFLPEADTF